MGATHANGHGPLATHNSGNLQMPSADVSQKDPIRVVAPLQTLTHIPTVAPVLRTKIKTAPWSADVTHVNGPGLQMIPCSGSQVMQSVDVNQAIQAAIQTIAEEDLQNTHTEVNAAPIKTKTAPL